MLNGIAPILIFTFKKKVLDNPDISAAITDAKAQPLVSNEGISIPFNIIPLYLDENFTGILVDSESKNIDIVTTVETLPDGTKPKVRQNGLNSSVTINMIATSDSLGLPVLSILNEQILDKVTSQEYNVSYFNKQMIVIGGLINGFSITQNANDNRYNITLELSSAQGNQTKEKAAVTNIGRVTSGGVP